MPEIRAEMALELEVMTRLSAPLALAEVGWMAMGVVDTMFVGRVSAEAIGALSVGTTVFYGVGIFASGLLLGLDTLVAQAFGAGDREDCRHSLINGIWLALFLMPMVMTLVPASLPLLTWFGVDRGVLHETGPYLHALNWSAPPLLLYFALRRYLQSVGKVRPIMITLLTANAVNLIANWILVFGNLGAPRMGVEGSGWATCLSRVFMAAALGVTTWRNDREILAAWRRPELRRVRQLLRLGLPAAGQIGLEWGVFATVTMLIGKLNAAALAGHQIALMTVSTTFMMPLGISSAAAVRVGQAIGRGDAAGAARSGWTALALGAMAMSSAAVALLLIPRTIARLFTPDAQIIASGTVLLRLAAFFQLFDGLQVVATGALRGAGDTRTPMLCHFAGYWLIGLPLGVLLCFHYGLGAAGLWMGLSSGLIVIGIVLAGCWRKAARRFAATAAMVQ